MEKQPVPNEIGKMQREPLVAKLGELRRQITVLEKQIAEGDAKLAKVGLTETQIRTQAEVLKFIREEIVALQESALNLEEKLNEIGLVLEKPIDEQAAKNVWDDARYQGGTTEKRGAL